MSFFFFFAVAVTVDSIKSFFSFNLIMNIELILKSLQCYCAVFALKLLARALTGGGLPKLQSYL